MGYLVRLSTAALIGLVASLVTFTTAPAAITPLPKMQAHQVTGWAGMVRRPGYIIIGNGGSPETANLTWSRWTASSGKATGKIELFWCAVFATCKPTVHRVTVWVNTPRWTGVGLGYPYFSRMIYQYVNTKEVTKRLVYTFGYHGGTVPSWT